MSNLIDTRSSRPQHYRDFLNREPEHDGLNFWTNEITPCGTDLSRASRPSAVNVSAAFLSIEFKRGLFVYRTYKASYGNLPGFPGTIKLSELLPDTQQIGQGVIVNPDWLGEALGDQQAGLASDFVQRSRFTSAYPTSMDAYGVCRHAFRERRCRTSGTLTVRPHYDFALATTTADVPPSASLRRVAENSTWRSRSSTERLLMQYSATCAAIQTTRQNWD